MPMASRQRSCLVQKGKQGRPQRLRQQAQNMQHRSRAAFPVDSWVPLPTHVAEDANEEVKHDELVRAAVIKHSSNEPAHWIDVAQLRSSWTTAPENVVSPEEPATGSLCHRYLRWCRNKCDDETNSCCKQRWNHQCAEPADIQTIVSGSNPLSKKIPVWFRSGLGTRNDALCHFKIKTMFRVWLGL